MSSVVWNKVVSFIRSLRKLPKISDKYAQEKCYETVKCEFQPLVSSKFTKKSPVIAVANEGIKGERAAIHKFSFFKNIEREKENNLKIQHCKGNNYVEKILGEKCQENVHKRYYSNNCPPPPKCPPPPSCPKPKPLCPPPQPPPCPACIPPACPPPCPPPPRCPPPCPPPPRCPPPCPPPPRCPPPCPPPPRCPPPPCPPPPCPPPPCPPPKKC